MAKYTSHFTKPYEGGWEDLPSETTPIDADALNTITDGIDDIDTFLDGMEQNAQVNVIEKIKVNGVEQTVTEKTVNISTESGTTDYADLVNKPQINSVELAGNKTSADLKIADEMTYAQYQALTDAQKNDGTLRVVKGYPSQEIGITISIPSGGTTGQFLVSDGNNGVMWETIPSAEGVSY